MSIPILEERSETAATGSENCLPVGARVAEFEITGVVGEGGFGIVYLAFDHSLQRVVALKEYMPGVMAGRGSDQSVVVRSKRHQDAFDTGLRSFINEARLLAQFDHPALIKIHRFWEQNNTGYMAMRYYKGQTLKRILQEDPGFVNEAWLKGIVQSILEALEALYKVQVLHRDISPENIMIQTNGEAVLLDFGAARQIISDMTQALTVILKPGYAPIEQYADDPSMLQGPWTDIYSLAAVMYVAVTNTTPPSSVARMIQDPIEPLASGSYPGYSQQFLRAIDQGMAVKPEHRPRTIAEFRALVGLEAPPAPIDTDSRAGTARAPVRKGNAGTTSVTQSGLTRHLPRPPMAASNPDSETRPMAQVAPTANGLASIPGTVATPLPAGGASLSGAASGSAGSSGPTVLATAMPSGDAPVAIDRRAPNTAAGTSGKQRLSILRTAVLGTVIMVAGLVTWRSTHRTDDVAPPPVLPASAATGEQVVDEETLAWETLRQKTDLTADQVSRFIAQYPNGRLIESARKRLDELRAAQALAAPTAVAAAASASPGAAPGAASAAGPTAAPAAPAGLVMSAAPSAGSATALKDAAAAVSTGAPADAAPIEPVQVAVTLSIKPWGNVTIDGVDRGVSPPLKKLMLAEGKHAIRIVNPGFPEHVAEIEVTKKKSARITVDFTPKTK